MSDTQINNTIAKVQGFILENFLFGDITVTPGTEDSLLEMGIIDSTGVMEIIQYIEDEFGVVVEDAEMVPENLDSITNIAAYVSGKLNVGRA